MDALWSGARVAVFAYCAMCVFVLVRQSRYVYYPDRTVALTPGYFKIPYESVTFRASDGETIAAWWVPPGREGVPTGDTVLLCHGNAGDIGDRIDSVRTFHQLGLGVLVFDYRGYGDSSGKPTEEGTYRDARAAWDYLVRERGLDAGSVVIFGRSLGGSVATWLATQVRPKALVIESTFTSAADMARKMFWFLPRFICRFGYDSLARIGTVNCPVIVAHSRDDEMIPYSHGERLFEAAAEPKRFVSMRGGHNAGGFDGDPDYQRVFMKFLAGLELPGESGREGEETP